MYDLDSNGKLDLEEMTKIVVDIYVMQLGYSMIGVVTTTAKKIFSQMDKNGDGYLSEDEFVMGCLQDEKLHMLMPLLSVPYPTGQAWDDQWYLIQKFQVVYTQHQARKFKKSRQKKESWNQIIKLIFGHF